MLTPALETSAELAAALLVHYSFDLSGHSASELVNRWQNQYPIDWLHLAVIEALYQGRYKGVSVQQILAFWLRRGQATYHFNMEFERLICSKFPESLTAMAAPALPPVNTQITFEKANNSQSLPVTDDDPLPEQVDNGYVQSQAATVQLKNRTEQEKRVENILASSTLSTVTTSEKQKLSSQEIKSLLQNSPHQIKLLPSAVNHPPIGQFTPETGDRSDSFTSKLKAISGDNS
ncbi:hypothetical protein [Halotia branconii]|uniref:Uncharacterized protein n=1 Tax=Halotia branconii CENA392 TaxID=1539056 RepID=A0AAJ6NXM4_9CYAN|nr:hypothetical protein [Halotia branconii]WGV28371.1 hypothetical protein QI031_13255 [Halotia branconii CENA392]